MLAIESLTSNNDFVVPGFELNQIRLIAILTERKDAGGEVVINIH